MNFTTFSHWTDMTEADWTLRMWRYLDANHADLLVGKERRLWDNTRVDILTKDWAIEVDWAPKWAEAIGQALYYSAVTGKKAGICLLSDFGDTFNVYRCSAVCIKYDIGLWMVQTRKSEAILPNGERIKI